MRMIRAVFQPKALKEEPIEEAHSPTITQIDLALPTVEYNRFCNDNEIVQRWNQKTSKKWPCPSKSMTKNMPPIHVVLSDKAMAWYGVIAHN